MRIHQICITSSLFGFRRGMGTLEACIDLIDGICEKMNERQLVSGLFLDLTKAFETIDHSILLRRLAAVGFRDNDQELIARYLKNRK